MKYFLDTEFLEGTYTPSFFLKGRLGNLIGAYQKPTIGLISIGIVSEDGREYYAISKDFNLKEAWNRYDLKPDINNGGMKKVYWIRENVLKPIWCDLFKLHGRYPNKVDALYAWDKMKNYQKYTYLKLLILKYGKTNKQIAEEIKEFCKPVEGHPYLVGIDSYKEVNIGGENTIIPAKHCTETIGERTAPKFYGYYSDYDWVVFCWLFGGMVDLPKGFPMYCIDLKQELDFKARRMTWNTVNTEEQKQIDVKEWLEYIKTLPNYPKQTNEHNALADAKWNKKLYEFINKL